MLEAELPAGASWHTAGWKGALLRYGELVGVANPQEELLTFLRAAHAAGASRMR
jgi:hypothetical protein